MKMFKKSLKLFHYNFFSIILFEIIYRLISMAALLPVLYTILNYSVSAAGIRYLSEKTVMQYFRAPSTYVLIFCVLILISIYFLINISGLIFAMEASYREEKTNPLTLLFKGFGNAFRVINPKNMGMMVYVLFVLPFSYTVMISGSLVGFRLPEFMQRFIRQNKDILTIVFAVYAIICLFSMLRIFALNYYTIYKMNYAQSVEISKKVVNKNIFRTVIGIVIYNLLFTALLFLLEGTLATTLAGILAKLLPYKQANLIFNSAIRIFFMILYLIFSVLSTPMIYAYICACFYEIDGDTDYSEFQEVKERRKKPIDSKRIKIRNRIAFWTMLILGIALNALYIYLIANNRVSLNIMYSTRASVTAHRGDSAHAPENTMAAFELAVESGADIIEIDVRQTRDGGYVIMHDESLIRTAGINRKVGEVTMQYISKLDVGSWFSEEYAGEHIPSFEEVLIFAVENDVFLNIELKPANTDQDYEQGIVALLEKYEYIDNCVVASSNYDTLTMVKHLNPDIKTLYIMSVAFGSFGEMEYVDGFSVRHNFVSADMVKDIHRNGKEIYAWTVNREEDIKNLLLLDVDGVITDDPYGTHMIINNANSSLLTDWLERLVHEY